MTSKKSDFFALDKGLVEKLIRKNKIYTGIAVDFCVDDVELPDGARATREYLDHPGAVGVVPLLPGGRVVLVRQYRHPVGEVTLELPAGKFDRGSKESVLECARRELREETGYTAKSLTPLIQYWPTCAFANELLHMFIAEGLVPGECDPDEDEFIETVELPLEEAFDLVRAGKIKDSKTIIGLFTTALWKRS